VTPTFCAGRHREWFVELQLVVAIFPSIPVIAFGYHLAKVIFSGGVTSPLDAIAAVAEQNSAAAQEVSASTEEVSAQVEEVVASSSTLSDMAGQLSEVVAQFRLCGDRTTR